MTGSTFVAAKTIKTINKLMVLTALVISTSLLSVPKAEAARCSVTSGSASCSYQTYTNYYWCGAAYIGRFVRYQVPEGTPPSGGWRTAFYYNGTTLNGSNPFIAYSTDAFGMYYAPQIFRELLDDPTGTGKKYAVLAPLPPQSSVFLQFWNTNVVFPYSASCDYQFFPHFFGEIAGGSYGSASQYNLNRRFAFGISSGGYNSSRMAVTFNGSNVWKALGVISASYATCSGAICSVPSLPSNHPPTKFWHGTADTTVPISTMWLYYNQMGAQGLVHEARTHSLGHQFTVDDLGSTGVKNFFDRYY